MLLWSIIFWVKDILSISHCFIPTNDSFRWRPENAIVKYFFTVIKILRWNANKNYGCYNNDITTQHLCIGYILQIFFADIAIIMHEIIWIEIVYTQWVHMFISSFQTNRNMFTKFRLKIFSTKSVVVKLMFVQLFKNGDNSKTKSFKHP